MPSTGCAGLPPSGARDTVAAVRALATALLVVAAGRAAAVPLLTPRAGGTAFEGPTDFEPAAIWYNPAALAGLRGVHASFNAIYQGTRGAYQPRSGDGALLSDDAFRYFGGLTWDFRLETFTFGMAVYAPWDTRLTVRDPASAAALASPTDYHVVEQRMRHIYVSLAGAVTIDPRFLRVGVSISPILSATEITFFRDGSLDGGSARAAEHGTPEAAQRFQLRGDGGVFWNVMPKPAGLAISLGVLTNPIERLFIGVSWAHVIPLPATSASYDRPYEQPDSLGAQVTWRDPGGAMRSATGATSVSYTLPDVWHIGARALLRADLEVSNWVRIVTYGGYGGSDDPAMRALVVRLGGPLAQQVGAPERLVFDRGLRPSVAVEAGLRYRPHARVRLGLSAIYESPAVPATHVTLAALDGHKVDVAAGIEVRPVRWLRLSATYAFSWLHAAPSPGAFDAAARVRCVDSRHALDACADDIAGRGHASAAGSYDVAVHRVSGGLGVDF